MTLQALSYLAHILWLLHHHYAHRAMLELAQLLWALQHGYAA
jgi:hypothetical protein